MNDNELRECPFCGQKPETVYHGWGGTRVFCANTQCWINNRITYPETWNERAPLDTKDFIVVRRDVFEDRYISREAYNALKQAKDVTYQVMRMAYIEVENQLREAKKRIDDLTDQVRKLSRLVHNERGEELAECYLADWEALHRLTDWIRVLERRPNTNRQVLCRAGDRFEVGRYDPLMDLWLTSYIVPECWRELE